MSTSTIVLLQPNHKSQRRQRETEDDANNNNSEDPKSTTTKAKNSKAKTSSSSSSSSSSSRQSPQSDVVNLIVIPLHPAESGSGTYQDPYRLPPTRAIAASPQANVANKSGCYVCPSVDSRCDCVYFTQCLDEAIAEVGTKRITSQVGRLDLCAKSVLPCFMNRMIKVMDMMNPIKNKSDGKKTFFDFGSGNGSVLFYIAWVTGIDCVGVELSPHNAELSKQLWAKLKPKLERRKSVMRQEFMSSFSSRQQNNNNLNKKKSASDLNNNNNNSIGNVTIICADVCDFLREHLIIPNTPASMTKKKGLISSTSNNTSSSSSIRSQKPPSNHSSSTSDYNHEEMNQIFTNNSNNNSNQLFIWTANLLMPKSVTHFMSECFRQPYVPIGTNIMAFDDLYPHGRAVARVRDPEAFEIFDMVDFMWQLGSVEWTQHVEGMFHLYIKKK